MAVVSAAGLYASLHLALDNHAVVFYSPGALLPPNQQHQSAEGTDISWKLVRLDL